MRVTSQEYKTLRHSVGSYYAIRVTCGNAVYTEEDIVSINISSSLFADSGPQIGQANSAFCELVLREESENWPRMAEFTVDIKILDSEGESTVDWLPMGTYYTDERVEDTEAGTLTINAYDGMLLMEQYWTDSIAPEDRPESWPITCAEWIALMEDAGLVDIDSRTVIDNVKPIVGFDTGSTVRDVLKTIAAAHGGNWIVTFENKLRLVQFGNASIQNSAIAGIAIAGIAVVGVEGGSGGSSGIDSEYLGFNVQSFETTPELEAITGVHLETDSGTVMEYGDDSGYVLQGVCNTSNTSGVAELCFDKTQDYIYRPFSATVAQLDPAAEIGDAVVIKNEVYQMMKIDWDISTWPTADISAAYEEEVDHEYKVISEQGKQYRKLVMGQEALGKKMTEISQTEDDFEIFVGNVYETKDDSNKKDNELKDRIDKFGMHYKFTETGEIIGHDGSDKSIRLSNDGIHMMVEEEAVVVITQNEMYAPRKVAIPLSGSLQMGNFLFQPRSSGNMSLLWVGES